MEAMEGEGDLKAPHRAHLEALARQGDAEAIAELAAVPPLPPLAAHVWAYFADLSMTRSSGGMGPARLTRHDIHAWEHDEGVRLESWERRAVLALDAAWLTSVANQQKPAE